MYQIVIYSYQTMIQWQKHSLWVNVCGWGEGWACGNQCVRVFRDSCSLVFAHTMVMLSHCVRSVGTEPCTCTLLQASISQHIRGYGARCWLRPGSWDSHHHKFRLLWKTWFEIWWFIDKLFRVTVSVRMDKKHILIINHITQTNTNNHEPRHFVA